MILYENGDILVRYAEGFSSFSSWYPGWRIPWLWSWWCDTFYYAGAPRSSFAVEFTYPEGAFLWPPRRLGAGTAGTPVTYTFKLRNNTGSADSFSLTSGVSLWDTAVEPAVTPPISDGHSITVTVTVAIPPGALPGDADTAIIEAGSISFPGAYTATATISTTALCTPALTFSGQTGMAASRDDIYDYGGQPFTYLYANAHTTGGSTSIRARLQAYDPAQAQWQTLGSWDQVGPDQLLIDRFFVPPAYTAVRVSMQDLYGYQAGYDYRFIVCRAPAVLLRPASQQAWVEPGATAVYTLALTNYMMITDTFELTVTGNTWPAAFWHNGAPITTTAPLADRETYTFTLQVEAPAGALPGQVDPAAIRATSLASPLISATAGVTTTALCSPTLLFSGQTGPAASLDDIYDYGGQAFTYLYANAHTTSGAGSMWAQLQAYDLTLGRWQTLEAWYDVGPDQLLIDRHYVSPAYSAVRISVEDHYGGQVTYDYAFAVCRQPAVGLSPPAQHSLTQAGTTVVYSHTVTNYTMATAAFSLTAAGNAWPTTLWHNGAPVTTTGAARRPGDVHLHRPGGRARRRRHGQLRPGHRPGRLPRRLRHSLPHHSRAQLPLGAGIQQCVVARRRRRPRGISRCRGARRHRYAANDRRRGCAGRPAGGRRLPARGHRRRLGRPARIQRRGRL